MKKFNFQIPIRSKKINELQFQFIESNSMNGLKNWTNYSSLLKTNKKLKLQNRHVALLFLYVLQNLISSISMFWFVQWSVLFLFLSVFLHKPCPDKPSLGFCKIGVERPPEVGGKVIVMGEPRYIVYSNSNSHSNSLWSRPPIASWRLCGLRHQLRAG